MYHQDRHRRRTAFRYSVWWTDMKLQLNFSRNGGPERSLPTITSAQRLRDGLIVIIHWHRKCQAVDSLYTD